jgi:hypothetical protein
MICSVPRLAPLLVFARDIIVVLDVRPFWLVFLHFQSMERSQADEIICLKTV